MKVNRTCWAAAQAGVPVVLVGDNGIGKSTCAVEFARLLDKKVVKIALLGAAAEDLLGYPIVLEEYDTSGNRIKYTEYARHTWLKDLGPDTVLVLEEIARLDNDRMQNVIAQILDKSLGQYNIPRETIIIGTTNVDDIAGINEINYNVLTRAAWYTTDVNLEEERKALVTGRYDLEVQVKKLPINWKEYIPPIRAHLGAFHTYRPSAFSTKNTTRTTTWPCPRTVNLFLVSTLAASVSLGYKDLEDYEAALTACCGPQFAEQYVSWRAAHLEMEPREVYEAIKQNKLPHKNANLMLAYLTEVQAWMIGLNDLELAKDVWQTSMNFISDKLLEESPETSVYIAYTFMQANRLIGKVPKQLVKLLGDL